MMFSNVIRLLVVALMVGYSTQVPRLDVTIFYETMCTDSASFFTNQLAKAYKLLGPYLSIHFIPYGRTEQWLEDDSWKFRCHHGERECYANEVHACAINKGLGTNRTVTFINCAMRARDTSSAKYLRRCANQCGISWTELNDCAKGYLGEKLLAEFGVLTKRMITTFDIMPTIVFGNQYDRTLNSQAHADLVGAICKQLSPPPSVCTGARDVYWY